VTQKRKASEGTSKNQVVKKSRASTTSKATSTTAAQQEAKLRRAKENALANRNAAVPTTTQSVQMAMDQSDVEMQEDISMCEAIEDIDIDDFGMPHFASEYVKDIFEYLKQKEIEDQPRADYLLQHEEINEAMRAILINWLFDVHMEFKTLPESMFLSVSILDRYLQNNFPQREQLQLVGMTAMFIACKYEETIAPSVEDFVYIADDMYTVDQVLDLEAEMLKSIDWNLAVSTPLHFLRRFSKAGRSDSRIHTLCKYFVELTMSEYSMVSFLPSLIAASSVYIARKMIVKTPFWNATLAHYTGYSEDDLRACAKSIIYLLKKEALRDLKSKEDGGATSVRPATRKYTSSRFFSIAPVALERVRRNMNTNKTS
tara:strand:+ start:1336 stop:2451 length:1116 start_codon:yes stop_codon:yes gene_type:complete